MGVSPLELAKRAGFTAEELAHFAKLWVSESGEHGHLRITSSNRLVIGPGVSDDAVATIVIRHMLEREIGRRPTEASVRAHVRNLGFRYVGGVKPLRGTEPQHSNAHRRSA